MARDIKMIYDLNKFSFDIKYNNGDLIREEGLETAVMMSLFTDRRATDDDITNNDDKRGWWGDLLTTNNDQIGSKLWLLDGKTTNQTLILAKQYIKDSLQWMIDDGVINDIFVATERQGVAPNYVLSADIKLYYKNGNLTAFKFKSLWEKQVEVSYAF